MQGDPGPPGVTGYQGADGPTGDPGEQGQKGEPASAGQSIKGDKASVSNFYCTNKVLKQLYENINI